jgi:hypothetical protein
MEAVREPSTCPAAPRSRATGVGPTSDLRGSRQRTRRTPHRPPKGADRRAQSPRRSLQRVFSERQDRLWTPKDPSTNRQSASELSPDLSANIQAASQTRRPGQQPVNPRPCPRDASATVKTASGPRRTHQRTVRARPRPARPFYKPAAHVCTPKGASASRGLVPRSQGPSARRRARVGDPRTSSTNRQPESSPRDRQPGAGPASEIRGPRQQTVNPNQDPPRLVGTPRTAPSPRGDQKRTRAHVEAPRSSATDCQQHLNDPRAESEPRRAGFEPRGSHRRRVRPVAKLRGAPGRTSAQSKAPEVDFRTPYGHDKLRGASHVRTGTHRTTKESHSP